MDAYSAAGPGGAWTSGLFHMLQYYSSFAVLFNVFTASVIDIYQNFFHSSHFGEKSVMVMSETDVMKELERKCGETGYELVAQPRQRTVKVYQELFAKQLLEILGDIARNSEREL